MQQKLEEILGAKIISNSSIGGGSIADSKIVLTESGKKYFLKGARLNCLAPFFI